jgi:CRP/FNR family nitrogen fixation transcriptional regulator
MMLARDSVTDRSPPAAAAWCDRPAAFRPRAREFDVLEQFGSPRSFHRGQELYAAGERAEFCYRIVSGSVRMVGLDADGRRQIAEFLLPGDLVGFDSLDTHHLTAEALVDTVVVRYPLRAVEALAERDGALARRLSDLTKRNLRRAHQRMFLLGRKSAVERLAAFLLEMAERMSSSSSGAIILPMTRADIADHLGLTIETVSRTITQLRREGAITPAGAVIEVRDHAVLEMFGSDTRH